MKLVKTFVSRFYLTKSDFVNYFFVLWVISELNWLCCLNLLHWHKSICFLPSRHHQNCKKQSLCRFPWAYLKNLGFKIHILLFLTSLLSVPDFISYRYSILFLTPLKIPYIIRIHHGLWTTNIKRMAGWLCKCIQHYFKLLSTYYVDWRQYCKGRLKVYIVPSNM